MTNAQKIKSSNVATLSILLSPMIEGNTSFLDNEVSGKFCDNCCKEHGGCIGETEDGFNCPFSKEESFVWWLEQEFDERAGWWW